MLLLSDEERNYVASLEYILLQYKNDPYVYDNVYAQIAEIRKNSQYSFFYAIQEKDTSIKAKTTKIIYSSYIEYTNDDIINLHRRDDVLVAALGLIPNFGSCLSLFAKMTFDTEQGQDISARDILSVPVSEAMDKGGYSQLNTGVSIVTSLIGIYRESRNTYNITNNFCTQEGDIYFRVGVKSDLGGVNRTLEIYLRNGEIVHVEDTGPIGTPAGGQFENFQASIRRRWESEGYISREEYDSIG